MGLFSFLFGSTSASSGYYGISAVDDVRRSVDEAVLFAKSQRTTPFVFSGQMLDIKYGVPLDPDDRGYDEAMRIIDCAARNYSEWYLQNVDPNYQYDH